MTGLWRLFTDAVSAVHQVTVGRVVARTHAAFVLQDTDGEAFNPQWQMTGPGSFRIDGADQLADAEADTEVWEPGDLLRGLLSESNALVREVRDLLTQLTDFPVAAFGAGDGAVAIPPGGPTNVRNNNK